MTNLITVNMAVLHSAGVAEYLMSADRRIVCGFRAALEALGIPVPEAAFRKPTGRPRMVDLVKAYHGDNPVEAIRDNQRKLEAKR